MSGHHYGVNLFKALTLVVTLICIGSSSIAQENDIIIDSLWEEVAYELIELKKYKNSIIILDTLKKYLPEPDKIYDKASCTLYQAFATYKLRDWDRLLYYLREFNGLANTHADSLDNSIYADYHYLTAIFLYEKGEYELETSHYKRVLDLLNGNEDDFSYRLEDVYANLGVSLQRMGDFQQAIPYLKYSLINLKDEVEKSMRTTTLALCYMGLDQMDLANEVLNDGYGLLKDQQSHPKYWNRIYSHDLVLAKLNNRLSQPQSSLKLLNKINLSELEIYKQIDVLFEKGIANYQLGNEQEAESYYLKALSLTDNDIIAKHPNLALCFTALAEYYLGQGNANMGLTFVEKAISLLEENANIQAKPIYYNTLLTRAATYDKLEIDQSSLESLKKASEILDTMILKNLESKLSKYFWIDKAKSLHEEIIKRSLATKDLAGAWRYIQKGKGVLLSQSLNQLLLANENEQLAILENNRRSLEMDINFLELGSNIDSKPNSENSRLQQLINLNEGRDSLDLIIENEYPGYNNWSQNRHNLSVEKARDYLSTKNSILLDMFVGGENIYLFGLTKNEQFLEVIPYNMELKHELLEFQGLLTQLDLSQRQFEKYCKLGSGIYNSVFKDILERASTKIDNIIFIPDEEFNYLPIGTLLTREFQTQEAVRYDQLSYLAKDYHISYEYATELFGINEKQADWNNKDVLVGFAPIFSGGNSPSRNLDSLLYNMAEVQIINKIIGGKINLAQTATKSNFLKDIQEYSIAHLATHATCNDSLPFNSHIQFYQDSLSLFEIVNIPNSLELIVLSACETGTGILRKGEGISSLARGFINSGCPSIVTTLWQVNDKQTARLMEYFYRNLQAGKAKHVSLGEAQRAYLSTNEAASFSHPYYWASFIQIGNTNPIQLGHAPPRLKLLVAFGILLLVWSGIRYFRKH